MPKTKKYGKRKRSAPYAKSHKSSAYGKTKRVSKSKRKAGGKYKRYNMKKNHNTNVILHGQLVRKWKNVECSKKKKIKVMGCWRLNEVTSGYINCGKGQQTNATLYVGTYSQFLKSDGNGYDRASGASLCMFEGNPYQKVTGSVQFADIGNTSVDRDDRLRLLNIKKKIHLTNSVTVSPISLEVYVVKYKQSLNESPYTYWQNAIYRSGRTVSFTGGTAQTLTSAATRGYGSTTDVGRRPDMCKGWKKAFEIVRKDSYDIAPGGQLILHYDFKYHGKNIDQSYITEMYNNSGPYIGNVTYALMFMATGGVGLDIGVTGVELNANTYSTMPVELGYVMETEYVCCQPEASRQNIETQLITINEGGVVGSGVDSRVRGVNVVDVLADAYVN